MLKPEIPFNESQRLKSLQSFNILDTLEEQEYDAITRIAADICNTPIALVSLVDKDRQWFKSHYGLNATETPRELAFCAHAINTPEKVLLVKDANMDKRFYDNPLVTGGPKVQFYAGAPLNTINGESIGTLCVIDTKPRLEFTDRQLTSLKDLANQVMAQLELRKQVINQEIINQELQNKNKQLKNLSHRLAHDMKTPLLGINSLLGFIKEDYSELLKETEIPNYLKIIETKVEFMESLINGIINFITITNDDIVISSFNISKQIKEVLEEQLESKGVILNLENCDHNINHSIKIFNQIFYDFMSNSIKFSNETAPIISISFSENKDFYSFIYEDNGPGIPKEYWRKVFYLFEKLNVEDSKSTGIGLTTIKSLVKKLGGTIKIDNRLDQKPGVRFTFSIAKNIS